MPDLQQIPRLGASACVWKDGKVLLVQRAKAPVGLWSLPGGQVEWGETAVAAAERELMEETGITARLNAFVGLYEIIRQDPPFHYAIACYGGFWTAGEATASSDALAVRWAAPGELGSLEFTPQVCEAIARAKTLLGID